MFLPELHPKYDPTPLHAFSRLCVVDAMVEEGAGADKEVKWWLIQGAFNTRFFPCPRQGV